MLSPPDSVTLLADLLDGAGESAPDVWRRSALPHQLPPDGGWRVWLMLGGRGAGKTWAGAHWLAERALSEPAGEWVVAAPTFRDVRVTCVEGPSGLLAALGARVARYVRSLGELRLANGAVIYGVSADEPDRFRGANLRGAWADELAAWSAPDSWDQLALATRIGAARTVVTTTPRPTPLVRGLISRPDTVTVRAATWANEANLSAEFLEMLRRQYEGTRLGRQELLAEILDDVPGALWTLSMIEAARWVGPVPDLTRVVVAVDPAVTSGESSDETGIVVAGTDGERVWVLADRSGRLSPQQVAARLSDVVAEFNADRVVGEVNNGGDWIGAVLRQHDASLPYATVTASRGKRVRAEPVAALYEQGRVHHVSGLSVLEDQLTSWTPDAARSPDRLDALVWAVSSLTQPVYRGPRITHVSRR